MPSPLEQDKLQSLRQANDNLYHTLLKPNRWYTGTSIKSWIRSNLFLPNLALNLNSSLHTNRWSAYAHFESTSSLRNLLQKCNLQPGEQVLLHPLLAGNLVQEVLSLGLQPIFLDIDKSTLSLTVQDVQSLHDTTRLGVVILAISNGLAKAAIELTELCYQLQIPVILVVTNPELTPELLQLMVHNGTTGVIYQNSSWFPAVVNQLTTTVDIPAVESWFISWYLEDRIVSSNESHLSQSQEALGSFLELWHYLQLQQIKQSDWKGELWGQFCKNFIYKTKFNNKLPSDVEQDLADNWNSIQEFALPDIVFEVEQANQDLTSAQKVDNLVAQWQLQQQSSQSLYNYLIRQIDLQPAASLEIPTFYLDQTYTQYHFYTLNQEYWINTILAMGYEVTPITQVHTLVAGHSDKLPNANLFLNFGILVKVPGKLRR